MKRNYDKIEIDRIMTHYGISDYFTDKDIPKFIVKYEKGEFISSTVAENRYIQFVIEGTISIYGIREDGSAYALAIGSEMYLIGDLDLFQLDNSCVYAEALTEVTCLAISINKYKDRLMNDLTFIQRIAESLAHKMSMITKNDVTPTTLESRVYNYMRYRCPDHSFTGIEKTAFSLHCSPRQLQRVMNELEARDVVKKLGKGKYKLSQTDN